jgi:AraC-like DNA-binding protein
MDFGKQLLFFFSALGTFNAVILGIYFFLLVKKKYLTNQLLGALILAYSVRTGTMVFVYFDASIPRIYLQLGLSACFFIGPLVYLFLKAATLGTNTMKRSWKVLLAAHLAFVLLIGIFFPYQQNEVFWNRYVVYSIYAQWLFFIVLSGHLMKDRIAKLFRGTEKTTGQEGWLLMIYVANLLIFTFYLLSIFRTPYTSCLNGSLVFTFMLYLAISILLYRKKTDHLFNFLPEKVNPRKIDAGVAKELGDKLEHAMAIEKVFIDADLKLSGLAKTLNVSPHQLSQFLNDNLDNNFTSYVNSYRIEAACTMLINENKLTLEAVGYEVGFNSKSTFFTAFKKHTGLTPLSYQQQALRSLSSDL